MASAYIGVQKLFRQIESNSMCVEATAFNLMQIGEITKPHSPKRSKDTGEKDTSCVLLLCKIQDAESAKNPEKS